MGYEIKDVKQAASGIKDLADSFNYEWFQDVTVRVRKNPFLVNVMFQRGDLGVACFRLIEQPNCCGALISTQTFVHHDYQGRGIAQEMMRLKEAIAREYNYSCLAATVNMTGNPAEIHILRKCGWTKGYEFTNRRTGNQVGFFFKGVSNEA